MTNVRSSFRSLPSPCARLLRMLVLPLAVLGIFAPEALFAQRGGQGGGSTPQPLTTQSNLPIYRVMRNGEVTIDINLWGYVNSPGHYSVPGSTSLVELLSFAGGPTAQARLVDVRIVHADTAQEQRVQTYNLEAYRDNGDLSQNPLLVPGDTIIVSGRALDVFFQAIGIITNIMVIITALINFISFTTK